MNAGCEYIKVILPYIQRVSTEKQYSNHMTSLKRLLINQLSMQNTQNSVCDCLIAFCECLQNRPISSLSVGDIINELVAMYKLDCKVAILE